MIEMIRSFAKVADTQLAQFERHNALTMPESYRQFLLEHNGGRPRDGEFPIPGWGVTVVDFFFGIGTGNVYDLQKHLDDLADSASSELIPIACDPGGKMIFLAVRGPHEGSVYFWDYEATESKPLLVAEEFGAFLNSLAPD